MEIKKNITLRVNAKLYDRYRKLCVRLGLITSVQFEIMMKEHLAGKIPKK